jgi:hypothetical protein
MVYDGSTPGVLMRLVLCDEIISYTLEFITKKGTTAVEGCGREISISK